MAKISGNADRFSESRRFGNEVIDVKFRKATSLDAPGVRYRGFNPGTTLLEKGATLAPGAMPLPCDILFERDVAVRMRDGIVIYADIFRPAEAVAKRKVPAIVGWGPFGKQGAIFVLDDFPGRAGVPKGAVSELQAWEAPDPAYWCNHGYAVVNPDPRGVGSSEGNIQHWGGAEARDGHDLIEWLAEREWCSGKIGMAGNSWLAILQWFVAAEQPPHLAAIAPWEGHIDLYRCDVMRGGIPNVHFNESIISKLYGQNFIEDVPAMVQKYPLMNGYWEDKSARLENIKIPAYIVASYFGHHTLDAFQRIGSRKKWLRIHNTNEWSDFYNPKNTEDLRRFFDYHLYGEDNGWEKTDRVRLSVYDMGGEDIVSRSENDFPLERTEYIKLYLDVDGKSLSPSVISEESNISCSDGKLDFVFDVEEMMELTGYFMTRLWVEVIGSDDSDIYINLAKIDENGNPLTSGMPPFYCSGTNGQIRISHRKTDPERSTPWLPYLSHQLEERVKPGQIVRVDIAMRPVGMIWHEREKLRVSISDKDLEGSAFGGPNPVNSTQAKRKASELRLYSGGKYDSYLLVPRVA